MLHLVIREFRLIKIVFYKVNSLYFTNSINYLTLDINIRPEQKTEKFVNCIVIVWKSCYLLIQAHDQHTFEIRQHLPFEHCAHSFRIWRKLNRYIKNRKSINFARWNSLILHKMSLRCRMMEKNITHPFSLPFQSPQGAENGSFSEPKLLEQ